MASTYRPEEKNLSSYCKILTEQITDIPKNLPQDQFIHQIVTNYYLFGILTFMLTFNKNDFVDISSIYEIDGKKYVCAEQTKFSLKDPFNFIDIRDIIYESFLDAFNIDDKCKK